MTSTAVRVGLRVRPLTEKEQLTNCTECVSFIPNEPQILIGTDKSFTFDYVFDTVTPQDDVYTSAAKPLLDKFLEGFNATILAYGQTGSGKTYSMGTSLENSSNSEYQGIVPRCIAELYKRLEEQQQTSPEFQHQVYVSFLELYNEDLIDLLNPENHQRRNKPGLAPPPVEISIREDIAGNIYWSGVKEEPCSCPEDLLNYLAKGSLCRTTGATDMNTVSSRSHAVFSIILKQHRPDTSDLISKFHFVDLAGSERLKRTNAQGDRAKEGIAINSGLLALGNVISALGDEQRRVSHVPYRDSKLTRLLQDSLGGNSQTLMLACVSPADTNFMETLNTLKYANRARNIKNRVVINQDFAGSSIEVNQLRAQVARLRMELASVRSDITLPSSGASVAGYSLEDNRSLRHEVSRLRERIQDLSTSLIQVTSERDTMLMEKELNDFLQYENQVDASQAFSSASTSSYQKDTSILDPLAAEAKLQALPMIKQYQQTIQQLTNELADTKDQLSLAQVSKQAAASVASFHYQHPSSSQLSSTLTFSKLSSSTKSRKANRRRRPMVASTSSSVTVRHLRHSSSSSTTATSRRRRAPLPPVSLTENLDDEGYIQDDALDDEVLRNDVKSSIAKAREEIQRGMQVLELAKPLEDTAAEWENELKAFEESEKKMYNDYDMQRLASDEGNYTASPSPDLPDLDDEIDALAVPSWDGEKLVKTDDDHSTASKTPSQQDEASAAGSGSNKHNPQMIRMLHQIQSDIRVKEELVSHLEKSETEYNFMRRKFDDKIHDLEARLVNLQQERDSALAQTKSTFASKLKQDATSQLREKQQLIDIRHAYENKMKSLLTEIQDLRRKYSQTTMTMQATRNQNDNLLRNLRVNVETLKMEKRRMIKRMKQEAERVREQMSLQDRKIHQLQRMHAEANQARRRLEREHEKQKLTLKRRNEEVLVNNNQLKQLTSILKKAVREGGVLDERLLTKVSRVLGGSFAILMRGASGMRAHGFTNNNNNNNSSSSQPRRGSVDSNGTSRRRPRHALPVHVRAARKKQFLDRALYQLIQGKQAIVEMEQLLFKRERLAAEKLELMEERKQIYMMEKKTAERTGQPTDTMGIELMDERIDMISSEISYLSARIRALQSDAAAAASSTSPSSEDLDGASQGPNPKVEKKVTFADDIILDQMPTASNGATAEDEWQDLDVMEEQFTVAPSAAPEVAYDMTLKILKSLASDECRQVAEGLVDDIVNVRTNECNRQVTMQNLERTVQDLRRTLIVMKRAAIATTVDNEHRIRNLEDKVHGRESTTKDHLDLKIEEYINGGNTIFDKIYEDGLRGLITTTPEPGWEYTSMGISPPPHPSFSFQQGQSLVSQNSSGGSSQNSDPSSAGNQDLDDLLSPLLSPNSVTTTLTSVSSGGDSGAPTRPGSLLVGSNITNSPSTLTNGAVRPPASLLDKGGKLTRDTTPSPDRFFNMIQKRLSWQQQQQQRNESPMAISMLNPAEFARYASNDRESSTSSIRSSHVRRSSIQSDYSQSSASSTHSGSVSSSNTSNAMRKRAFSLQQPPVPSRRRPSLRELSMMSNTIHTTMSSPRHVPVTDQLYYPVAPPKDHHQPLSPRTSASTLHYHYQQMQQQQPRSPSSASLRRPSSVATFTTVMNSHYQAMERHNSAGSSSPSPHNVFDRLSQTPTRASSAKMAYRHSISSMDDLHQRYDSPVRTSSAMGNH
ncbi:kinesin-domain-containing protein [Hesseltinella vesiculosa]|uniref:Kinesin-domain-containing protein n=1 Tax=Hesseltinella vesiculosa TaxID=101127 RepID=A0A1X2GG80_9FUNG|nr:kinesin-domain-containing protein [Hesseltinella vesiculosa]